MPDEFPEHHLPAADRIAEQQQQRAALGFADDGVVGDQESDQRHEEDREAGQADDHHVERVRADIARGRAAEERQRERQGGEQHGRGENPAVPQALLDFLSGDEQDAFHRAVSRSRRKCA